MQFFSLSQNQVPNIIQIIIDYNKVNLKSLYYTLSTTLLIFLAGSKKSIKSGWAIAMVSSLQVSLLLNVNNNTLKFHRRSHITITNSVHATKSNSHADLERINIRCEIEDI